MKTVSDTQLGIETIRQFFEDKIEKSLINEYKEIIKSLKTDGLKQEIELIAKSYDNTQYMNMRLNQLLKFQDYWQSLAIEDASLFEQLQDIITAIQADNNDETDTAEKKKTLDQSFKALQKMIAKSSEAKEVKAMAKYLSQKKYKADDLEKNTHIINVLKQTNPTIAQLVVIKKQEIIDKFEPNQWISNASVNAQNVYLNVTHVGKLTHSSARNKKINANHGNLNSLVYEKKYLQGQLTSNYLRNLKLDFAYTDSKHSAIAEFMTLSVDNKFLGELICEDIGILGSIAESQEQLQTWIDGFLVSFNSKEICSHELLKQVYFPVGDTYHILCPLMSSSLAQAVDDRIWETRQDDMPARIARKNNRYSEDEDVIYPLTAKIQVTQSNHQNVSNLNGKRTGRLTLLSSAPPAMTTSHKTIDINILKGKTIFNRNLAYLAQVPLQELRNLLLVLKSKQLGESLSMKKRIVEIINNIVDVVLNEVALIQNRLRNEDLDISQLSKNEQYWLAVYRVDDTFQDIRSTTHWQDNIALAFAEWINHYVNSKGDKLALGVEHRKQWQKILTPTLRAFIAQTEASRNELSWLDTIEGDQV